MTVYVPLVPSPKFGGFTTRAYIPPEGRGFTRKADKY
jgi:hypothetical protein